MLKKLKSAFFLLMPLALAMSSCLKDDVEDLEKKLNAIESALGANEPIVMNFSTSTADGVAIEKNAAFLFKTSDYYGNSMTIDADGTYYIYVYRGLDVDFGEYTDFGFSYNPATKEVSDEYARVSWRDQLGTRINPYFNSGDVGTTFTLDLKSIDIATGRIDVVINASTDENSSENEYDNQPITCKLEFKGKLGVFIID